MTERVYRLKTEKFDLILTTIKDISDFNHEYIRFEGSLNYRTEISNAHRSCVVYGMQGWNSHYIKDYALKACNMWDALKLVPDYSFLLENVYEPLNLKLAVLRRMVNNFSASDDDNHFWTFVNDQLTISDAANENPVYGHSLNDTHNGNA
jgi:hypothetical protein